MRFLRIFVAQAAICLLTATALPAQNAGSAVRNFVIKQRNEACLAWAEPCGGRTHSCCPGLVCSPTSGCHKPVWKSKAEQPTMGRPRRPRLGMAPRAELTPPLPQPPPGRDGLDRQGGLGRKTGNPRLGKATKSKVGIAPRAEHTPQKPQPPPGPDGLNAGAERRAEPIRERGPGPDEDRLPLPALPILPDLGIPLISKLSKIPDAPNLAGTSVIEFGDEDDCTEEECQHNLIIH
jgi:hypothetical protein